MYLNKIGLKIKLASVFIFLLTLMAVFSTSITANAAPNGDSDFKTLYIQNRGLVITEYLGTRKDVEIPTAISGGKVYGIGKDSFKNKGITSLIIPNGIEDIESGAFSGNQLTTLIIPADVKSIQREAFKDNNITSITFNSKLKHIGSNSFSNNKITSLDIPDSVTDIGDYSFSNNMITNISLPANISTIGYNSLEGNNSSMTIRGYNSEVMDNFVSKHKYSFQSLGNYVPPTFEPETSFTRTVSNGEVTITKYNGSNANLNIPPTIGGLPVVKLGDGSFKGKNIVSVIIPNTVKTIGKTTFENNLLTNLKLPDSVEIIDESSFYTNQLYSVTLPNNGKDLKIGFNSFASNRISEITIPEGVTTLEQQVFAYNLISDLNLPSGIKTIGRHAFISNKITKLEIKEGLETIHELAFYNNKIREIYLPSTLTGTPLNFIQFNFYSSPSEVSVYGYDNNNFAKQFASNNGFRYNSRGMSYTPPVVPTIPPTSPPTGGTGSIIKDAEVDINSGELLFKAPNINSFPSTKLKSNSVEVWTNFDSNAEILDSRGTGEGWRLTLNTSTFKTNLSGSDYSLPSGRLSLKKPTNIVNRFNGSSDGLTIPITDELTDIDGMGPIIVAFSNANFGKAVTDLNFDLVNTLKLTINPNEVLVDKTSKQSTYTSVLTWSLTEAP